MVGQRYNWRTLVFDEDGINQISQQNTITQSDNSSGNDASNAIDGDLNTYNSNGERVDLGYDKWVEVTLNKPSRVSRFHNKSC